MLPQLMGGDPAERTLGLSKKKTIAFLGRVVGAGTKMAWWWGGEEETAAGLALRKALLKFLDS